VSWAIVALALSGWFVALVVWLALSSRARRHGIQLAVRLRSNLRPYLQRRAVDAGVEVDASSGVGSLEEVVDDLCTVARRLIEHDRSQMELGDTVNMATSATQPMDTGEIEKAERDG
jgi:hypothetical protein